MDLTLLIDLDDTLLGNEINDFIPVYLQALSGHMSEYAEPGEFTRQLMAGTQLMINNERPDLTLKQVFDEYFYPAIGVDAKEAHAIIEDFYIKLYPSLKPHTQLHPESVDFIQQSIQRGYKLAIATNPLFPYLATSQRLEWAGLNPQEFDFEFVSTYEDFHFAKPNVAYYAECMGKMGWPESGALMIGNDLELDILPAKELGLKVFAVSTPRGDKPEDLPSDIPSGSISSVIPWIDKQSPQDLIPEYNNQTAILAILKSTPAVIRSFAESIPSEIWSQRPPNNEWSFTEILCHLRDVEIEVNIPRIERIIEEGNPFILGYDTDVWATERDYINQDGPEALQAFMTTRIQTVARLESLDSDAWNKLARHSIIGPTTMLELLQIMASHDRIHVRQILQDIYESLKTD